MQETVQGVAQTLGEPTVEERPKKSKKKHLIWLIPLLLLAGIYSAGVAFFSQNFLPNTSINGQNAGGKTVTAVSAIPQAQSETASLELITLEGDVQAIKLSDISYACRYDSDLAALHGAQSPFLWPMAFFEEEKLEVPVAVSYDEAALDAKLQELPCFTDPDIQPPVDAHLEKTEDGFQLVEPVPGNTLDYVLVWQTVTKALDKAELAIDLAEYGCYKKPLIQADDPGLKEQLDYAGKFKDVTLTIDLTDIVETLSYNDFQGWLFTDGSTIFFNEDAAKEYVTDLANKYNTFETQRTFNATGIGPIQVGASGVDTYGFQMYISKTQEALMAALGAQESAVVTPVWRIPGHCRGTANGDIGGTYIEADISRQHLWYYKDGAVQLESDFVSGLESDASRRTPSGVFRVWGKQRDRTLRGDDYESDVSYWMPFTWTGCGLHDATWRGAFGGSIYRTNGSHGCLNLPPRFAASLYEAVDYDTPVIVYRS